MRRLAGILKNSLTALSLLLCVAVCVLWVRSYSKAGGDMFVSHSRDRSQLRLVSRQVACPPGRIRYAAYDSRYRDEKGYQEWADVLDSWVAGYTRVDLSVRLQAAEWMGFSAHYETPTDAAYPKDVRLFLIQVPHWFLAALLAVLPGVWLAGWYSRRRERKRSRLGLCAACGYDLTGNISGVCPECGMIAGLTANRSQPLG